MNEKVYEFLAEIKKVPDIVICPLSSRQGKYIKWSADERSHKLCGRFSMHTISFCIFLFFCFQE